jgi:small subunit ribosomal protein S3
MEEKKTVQFKKDEFSVKEFVRNYLGKGKMSGIRIEYTPVGEKIILVTNKPGLVIGRRGEKIEELTRSLKARFKLENPHIEIEEIIEPEFDAQIMSDEIASALENTGPLKFKVIAYKALQKIMNAGALGAEIRINGKVPGARAKPWRFSQGYLKKVGDSAKVVSKAQAKAQTRPGTIGVKVSILSPHAKLSDRVEVNEEFLKRVRENEEKAKEEKQVPSKKKKKEKQDGNAKVK